MPGGRENVTTFTASVCGGTVAVKAGEVFALELEENPTTGYRWDFTADAGVSVISSSYAANPGGMIGGAGLRQFQFQTNTPGAFALRGRLMRSWLGDASTIQRCEITVQVSA